MTFENGETVPVTSDKTGETSSTTNLKLQYLQYEHASTAPINRPPTFHATNEDISVPPVMKNDNNETQLSSTFKRSSNLPEFYNSVDSRQCSHQFQSHPKATQTDTHIVDLESFSSTRKRIVKFSPSLVTEVWFGPSSKRIEEEWHHQYYCSSDELEHCSLIDEEYGMSWQKMGTPMLKRAVIIAEEEDLDF